MEMTGDSQPHVRVRRRLPAPFSTRVLRNGSISPWDNTYWVELLPASFLSLDGDLAATASNVAEYVRKELDLGRLSSAVPWLWLAGRPLPPRPLHEQLTLDREIFITERMGMHLVWTTGRIFLKPIPRFLLEVQFWDEFLSCQIQHAEHDCPGVFCSGLELRQCALGFLFSYAALIRHEIDHRIALEEGLLPAEVEWPAWKALVHELRVDHVYAGIDRRFYYGELRSSRLDQIYKFGRLALAASVTISLSEFVQDNLGWLASATVYIVVILTAMQVGLDTEALSGNSAFQSASYGFAVFSILGPIATVAVIIFVFCFHFIQNWAATMKYTRRRFRTISRDSTHPPLA